jgi:hypothetical protein
LAPVRRTGAADAVFVNVPFDPAYERLLIALVAGLTILGLDPHSVLEIPPYGADRLTRLKEIIRSCRYSVHDLSRRVSRFNMPFELGLALGLHHEKPEGHTWIVLHGGRDHALKACLSDIDGYDVVHSHSGSPGKLLACLNEVFRRQEVTLADLEAAHRSLRQLVSKGRLGSPRTRHGFKLLTAAAAEQAAILRSR